MQGRSGPQGRANTACKPLATLWIGHEGGWNQFQLAIVNTIPVEVILGMDFLQTVAEKIDLQKKLCSANRTSTPMKPAVDVLGLYEDKENAEPQELLLSTISTQINSLTDLIVSDQAVRRSQVQTAQRDASAVVAIPPVALAFNLKITALAVRTESALLRHGCRLPA